ncbi:hypothetical protein K2173_006023 [Erythroxylum novogranatense]|uniref:ZF-HD dimerization-type domain-containing protein n=1 Tax=Erythroxylum novogranatense TaxID=1862640 RepID=A0AAV8TDS3_9ROSI|nr:hypothetical protein K2173_006023 [Erythroxylum novogranatense]
MELRGQDKGGMPSSSVYNTVERDSSSKLPSISIIPDSAERRRDDQTASDLAPIPVSATVVNTAPSPSRLISRSPPPTSTASSIKYRECLRNHAANMGGHVLDGCGEFMASGEEGTPESLRCAACECHRNFHRKETDGEPNFLANYHYQNNSQRNTSYTTLPHQQLTTSLPPQHASFHQHLRQHIGTAPIAPIMMTFGGTAESSSEDLNIIHSNLQAQASVNPSSSSKKRFRTKFSQEQKDKMMEFAEKLEWKIQKQNEQEVQQFCSQMGIKRKVFKVWMHNNKQATKKKQM